MKSIHRQGDHVRAVTGEGEVVTGVVAAFLGPGILVIRAVNTNRFFSQRRCLPYD